MARALHRPALARVAGLDKLIGYQADRLVEWWWREIAGWSG